MTIVHTGVRAHQARFLAHKGVPPDTARRPPDVNQPTPTAWPPAARIAKLRLHYVLRQRGVRGVPRRYGAARREPRTPSRARAVAETATKSLRKRAARARA